MMPSVTNDLKHTWEKLLDVLASFPADTFNRIPFEGSWTAAQVAEHLVKSNSGVLEVLQGQTAQETRSPWEKIPGIKKLFLDFSLKFQSPVEILPGNQPIQKENIMETLKTLGKNLTEIPEKKDTGFTCMDAELPGDGYLTRLEWLYFSVYHTQRHIVQLEKIKDRVAG